MELNKETWKELDINVDSLWMIGPRAKGGKRENNYHGNFVPQIPDQMIRRYTPENGIVLDMFMGSGITGVVTKKQNKNYIGIELNEKYIDIANKRISEV